MKIVRIWEGLGNQMFQYAFAKSMEMNLKEEVYLDVNRSFITYLRKFESNVIRPFNLDKFNISLPTIEVEDKKEWQFIKQNNFFNKFIFSRSVSGKHKYQFVNDSYDVSEYHPEYLIPDKNVYYMGWYQCEKYFESIRSILLQEFTLKEMISIPEVISENDKTVSIHVRRGDFVSGNWCVPDEYYNNAIQIIEEKIENPTYIVFTDDVEWVKNNLFSNKNAIYVSDLGNYTDYQELTLMTKCKHNIIANSTYSWWGAWLNQNENKIVIAPKEWTPRQQNVNCESWIQI